MPSHALRALVSVAAGVLVVTGCAGSFSATTQQGKTIAPDGAGYAYVVPDGFFIETDHPAPSNGRTHESGVFLPIGAVAIRVSEQSLVGMPADTPAHVANVEAAFMAQANRWANPATRWRHESIANAPALEYHLSGRSSEGKPEEQESVAVFSGLHLVYVDCMWRSDADRAAAMKGCGKVLGTLRIARG